MTIVKLPETPAGKQAAWLLDRFGQLVEDSEITDRFAPAFLSTVSLLKVRNATESMKGHLPLTVTDVTGNDVKVKVSLVGTHGLLLLSVTVAAEEPHHIIGLAVDPVRPTVGDALRGASPRRDVEALMQENLGAYASGLRGESVGIAAAVLFENETTVRAYGAVAEDSVFEIGSITKVVTATLLADLVASKEVALDDPVERYLPEGSRMPSTEPSNPITLLELATHSSGLPRLPANLGLRDKNDPYATFTTNDLFEGLSVTPLQIRGTFDYSNLGYALLGQVLARAAGSSYEDIVTSRVLVPLAMVDSSLGPDPTLGGRRVDGHKKEKVVPHWAMTAIRPAGGIEATVSDVLAFGAAHCSSDPDSALALTHARRLSRDDNAHIGLGWLIEETEGGDVLWHNGGTGGFQSFLGFHHETGTVVAAIANAADGGSVEMPAASVLGSLVAAAHR